MSRIFYFARRNCKEILRDPLSLFFGICFPILLLILLHIINSSIPEQAHMDLFHMQKLAPAISVFGTSFLALFSAMLLAKDRGSSFMLRLYVSPMQGREFILGYLLPMLLMAVGQLFCFFAAAVALGMPLRLRLLLCIAVDLPIAVVNIAVGIICGCCMSEKAVGGICGALLTNLSAWLSGAWFSLDLVGGAFKKVAYILPFAHAVDACRAAATGAFGEIFPSLGVVCAWAAGLTLAAIVIFHNKMRIK